MDRNQIEDYLKKLKDIEENLSSEEDFDIDFTKKIDSVLSELSEDLTEAQKEYQRRVSKGGMNSDTQSGDFEMSLLVLASIVIKSDGKIDQRELNFVRSQFVSMYGKERANSAFKLFNGIIFTNKGGCFLMFFS